MAISDALLSALRSALPPSTTAEYAELARILGDSWVRPAGSSESGTATKITGNANTNVNGTTVVIVTGLTTVKGFSVMQLIATAPTTTTMTWDVSGGTVTVYFWGPTAAGNTALQAKTITGTIGWMALGT
jgi:hypothetical protein